jgi:hypothetical protein
MRASLFLVAAAAVVMAAAAPSGWEKGDRASPQHLLSLVVAVKHNAAGECGVCRAAGCVGVGDVCLLSASPAIMCVNM